MKEQVVIRKAKETELQYLRSNDRHISEDMIKVKISRGEIIVLLLADEPQGWLRYNLFWDLIPFMNLLRIEEPYRGQGYGKMLVEYWQRQMKQAGFSQVITSTLSNETAQHFYRRLGYRDIGAFVLPGEAAELIFLKEL